MNYEQALTDIKRKRKELARAEAEFQKIENEFMAKVGKTQTKGNFAGLNTRVIKLVDNEAFIFTNTNTGHSITTRRYGNRYGERKVHEIVKNGKRVLIMDGTRASINDIKAYAMSK
jgi:hypothetical protein